MHRPHRYIGGHICQLMGWTPAHQLTSRRANTRGQFKSTTTACHCVVHGRWQIAMEGVECSTLEYVLQTLTVFVMPLAITNYCTSSHRQQTKLLIDK